MTMTTSEWRQQQERLLKRIRRHAGVYGIHNISDGRWYVGATTDLGQRRRYHCKQLEAGTHGNAALQADFTAQPQAFRFHTLEVLYNLRNLSDREQYWIDVLCAIERGYNTQPATPHRAWDRAARDVESMPWLERTPAQELSQAQQRLHREDPALWLQLYGPHGSDRDRLLDDLFDLEQGQRWLEQFGGRIPSYDECVNWLKAASKAE